MISEIVTVGLFAATIAFTTPIVLAALGGLVADRSGVPNIAMEGIMYVGAFVALATCFFTGNAWVGTLMAAFTGVLFALILSIICVKEAGDVVVGGFALIFIAWGIAPLLSMLLFGTKGLTPRVEGFLPIGIPFLKDIPVYGVLFQWTPLAYFSIMILPVIIFILLTKTMLGKHITAVGIDPFVADTNGINVFKIRFIAIILSGVLASIGGAELSLGIIHRWSIGLVVGHGFIAIAAYLLGKRRPLQTLAVCIFFGFSQALSIRFSQVFGWFHGSTELAQMIPYILTILILGIVGKGEFVKFAKPYKRE